MFYEFKTRIKAIRWVNSCSVPSREVTDDENCAHLMCCPCYAVGMVASGALVALALPFMLEGYMCGECCGSAYRVCTGKARNPTSTGPKSTGAVACDGLSPSTVL